MINQIKPFDVIEFTYKNYRGEVGKRRAVYGDLQYGSNEYHKEEQFLLQCFDLDKGAIRSFAMNDISELKIVQRGKQEAYVVIHNDFDGVWYSRNVKGVFLKKYEAEHFLKQYPKIDLEIEEYTVGEPIKKWW